MFRHSEGMRSGRLKMAKPPDAVAYGRGQLLAVAGLVGRDRRSPRALGASDEMGALQRRSGVPLAFTASAQTREEYVIAGASLGASRECSSAVGLRLERLPSTEMPWRLATARSLGWCCLPRCSAAAARTCELLVYIGNNRQGSRLAPNPPFPFWGIGRPCGRSASRSGQRARACRSAVCSLTSPRSEGAVGVRGRRA